MAASLKISELNAMTAIADDDLFLVTDTSATTSKKLAFSTIKAQAAAAAHTVLGVVHGTAHLGTFSGSTIPNSQTVKQALQALETRLEAVDIDTDDMATLVGLAENVQNLGTFSGSTIADNDSIKDALQSLETATELRATIESPTFGTFASAPEFRANGTGHLKLRAATGNDLNIYLANQETLQITRDPSTGNPKFTAKGGTGEFKFNQIADLAGGFKVAGTEVTATAAELNYVDGVTSSIQTQLDTNRTDATAAATAIQADVDQNEADADAAIAAVQADVDQNETDADTAIAAVQADVDANEAVALAARNAIQADVDQNEADADTAIALRATIDDPTFTTKIESPEFHSVGTGHLKFKGGGNDIIFYPQDTETLQITRSGTDCRFTSNGGTGTFKFNQTTNFAAGLTSVTAGAATNTTEVATTEYVTTAIANLTDSAPGALNTLNELAAAMGDDANFSTTITNLINDNETHIDNVATLVGVAKDSANFGTFTGSTIGDNLTLKNILQALETDTESRLARTGGILTGNLTLKKSDGSAVALVLSRTDHADMNTVFKIQPTYVNSSKESLVVLAGSDPIIYFDERKRVSIDKTDPDHTLDVGGDGKFSTNLIVGGTLTLGSTAITATAAELNYTDGVTSNIQTQLNAIQADVDQNESDADSAIAAVQADVDQNESDADTAIALKANKAGDTFTGNLTLRKSDGSAVALVLSRQDHPDMSCAWKIQPSYVSATKEVLTVLANGQVVAHFDERQRFAINMNDPDYTLDVGGDGHFSTNLVVDGTLTLGSVALTATGTELNYTDGVTSNIQTQLDTKSTIASPTFTGTPAAPTATAGTNTTQIATTAFVTTAVANTIDSAPGALDTLNELAAALGDDANFSTTVTNLINANETHIDNAVTLTGVAKDATNLGTFTGSTISDNVTIKAAVQALETKVEAVQTDVDGNESDADTAIAANETHIDNMATLTGVAKDATSLGTFTGSTVSDSRTVKQAIQELETSVETKLSAETITLTAFKAVVAASSDFGDFQTRVAAL